MGLLRKLQVLVGALVHKPFMPKRDQIDLDDESASGQQQGSPPGGPALETSDPEVPDQERVADLLAQQRRDQAV